MEDLNDNTLTKKWKSKIWGLATALSILIESFHSEIDNIERAVIILKIHELYLDGKDLKFKHQGDSLFKTDMNCGDHLYTRRLIRTIIAKGLVLVWWKIAEEGIWLGHDRRLRILCSVLRSLWSAVSYKRRPTGIQVSTIPISSRMLRMMIKIKSMNWRGNGKTAIVMRLLDWTRQRQF